MFIRLNTFLESEPYMQALYIGRDGMISPLFSSIVVYDSPVVIHSYENQVFTRFTTFRLAKEGAVVFSSLGIGKSLSAASYGP